PLTIRVIAAGKRSPDPPGGARFEPDDEEVPIEATSDANGIVKWSFDEGWSLADVDDFERRAVRVEVEQPGKTGIVAVAHREFPKASSGRQHDLRPLPRVSRPRCAAG